MADDPPRVGPARLGNYVFFATGSTVTFYDCGDEFRALENPFGVLCRPQAAAGDRTDKDG